uniref:Nucleolar 27S pre-rRNA processing Urb2/Npa2 C-terminal domain-containing protein n=1 Tax=Ciona savignyi TaxID=51511 RepID=H2YF05_CIOSA
MLNKNFRIEALLDKYSTLWGGDERFDLLKLQLLTLYAEIKLCRCLHQPPLECLDKIMNGMRQGEATTPNLRFLQLITATCDGKSASFSNSIHSQDETAARESAQLKLLRGGLDFCSNFPQQSNIASLLPLVMSTMARIVSLGPKVISEKQIAVIFPTLSRFNSIKQKLNGLENGRYLILSFLLVNHKSCISHFVPLILSSINHFTVSAVFFGKQTNKMGKSDLKLAMQCAEYVSRILQIIASNHSSCFKRCVPYLISRHLHQVTTVTLLPSVKNLLDVGIYHLLSITDEFSISMLKASLPMGDKEVFRKLHCDFVKYFKYMGHV